MYLRRIRSTAKIHVRTDTRTGSEFRKVRQMTQMAQPITVNISIGAISDTEISLCLNLTFSCTLNDLVHIHVQAHASGANAAQRTRCGSYAAASTKTRRQRRRLIKLMLQRYRWVRTSPRVGSAKELAHVALVVRSKSGHLYCRNCGTC